MFKSKLNMYTIQKLAEKKYFDYLLKKYEKVKLGLKYQIKALLCICQWSDTSILHPYVKACVICEW